MTSYTATEIWMGREDESPRHKNPLSAARWAALRLMRMDPVDIVKREQDCIYGDYTLTVDEWNASIYVQSYDMTPVVREIAGLYRRIADHQQVRIDYTWLDRDEHVVRAHLTVTPAETFSPNPEDLIRMVRDLPDVPANYLAWLIWPGDHRGDLTPSLERQLDAMVEMGILTSVTRGFKTYRVMA